MPSPYKQVEPGIPMDMVAITPSDVTIYDPPLIGVRIGGIGTLTVLTTAGSTISVPNCQVAETIVAPISQVLLATTATALVGFVDQRDVD